MGTLVERKSRFLLLTKLDYPDAEAVLEGFIRRMRTLPASLHKTLTYDQPNEMAHHWDLACPLRLRGHYRRVTAWVDRANRRSPPLFSHRCGHGQLSPAKAGAW